MEDIDDESDLEEVLEFPSAGFDHDDMIHDESDDDDQEEIDQENLVDQDSEPELPTIIPLQDDFLDEEVQNDLGFGYGSINANTERQRIMELDVGPDGLEIHWAQGVRREEPLDEDLFPARGARRGLTEDALTHPLLQQRVEVHNHPRVTGTNHRSGGDRSNGELLDWRAFDDAVGGNALQILEQIFSRTRGRAAGTFRIVEVPSGLAAAGVGRDNVDSPEVPEDNSQKTNPEMKTKLDDRLSLLHSFTINTTVDRWKQEVKLMYLNSGAEKCLKLSQAILNILIPIAKEAADQKSREEEEDRKLIEEEIQNKKTEEEEKAKKDAELKKSEVLTPAESGETPAITDVENEPEASERLFVNINGRAVDITGKLRESYM